MVQEPATLSRMDDPDTPSEAVGSWPTIDLARLGLPRLGWLFVVAAAFVAVADLRSIQGPGTEYAPAILLSALAATGVVLLPAALLWRVSGAAGSHRLLLAGLACGAAAEIVVGVLRFWPLDPDGASSARAAFAAGRPLLDALGGLLVGLGLLRLRAGAARLVLLAVIASIYVALAVSSFVIGTTAAGILADPYNTAFLVIGPAAAAFAVWVSVAAWLDREPPRAFWGLLALAFPISLVSRVFALPWAIAAVELRSNALYLPGVTINGIAGAVIALLALVAFARCTPVAEPASTSGRSST